MTKPKLAIGSRVAFMILSVACLAPFAIGALIAAESDGEDSLYKQLSVLSEVLTLIQRTYVDDTSIRDLLDGALEGATDALDPLSTFVPADFTQTYAETRRVGSSHSGLQIARDRGVAYVMAVDQGSPSAAAGVKRGDVIAAVDGASTRNMGLWRLQGILAAAPGTEVELELLRDGQSHTATLLLAGYDPPRPSVTYREDLPVLTIPGFDRAVTGLVRDLMADSIGSEQELVVDVRGAAGGEPEAAYEIAALFTSGRLGSLRSRETELRAFDNDLPPLWQGTIAVVVDGGTQGAAEILAAILEQSTSATLVGEPTFGLAGRVDLIDLPSGGQVVMTGALFTGPDGKPIDERLRPDEMVRSSLRSLGDDDLPLEDLMLDRALEVLRSSRRKAA